MKRLLPPLGFLLILLAVACSSGSQEPLPPDSPFIRTLPTATGDAVSTDQSYPVQSVTAETNPEITTVQTVPFEIPLERFGFPNECIDTRLWTLFEDTGQAASYENCLMISNLGFMAMDDALMILVMGAGQGQSRALYTPLPANALVQYQFSINTLDVGPGEQIAIRVGIVPATAPPSRQRGIFLEYRNSPGSSDSYSIRLSQSDIYSEAFYFSGVGDVDFMEFNIENGRLSISVNEEPVSSAILLSGEPQLLWIEYYAPGGVTLGAEISSLTISGK